MVAPEAANSGACLCPVKWIIHYARIIGLKIDRTHCTERTAVMPSFLHVKRALNRTLRITRPKPGGKSVVTTPAIVGRQKAIDELVGKALFFEHEGQRVAGKALRVDGRKISVGLAVPNRDGLLCVSDSEIEIDSSAIEPVNALMSQKRVKHFEAGMNINVAADRKYVPVMDKTDATDGVAGVIEDYKDVFIEGYASTFVSTTPKDRIGDYIMPGAFDDTLAQFSKNPVILTNHENTVESLVGSWDKLGITTQGLAVRGRITNAPCHCGTRFKLVEGHLKGLSIGGIWYYAEDGYGIEEATLYEISLVAVPMNPDALVQTRALNLGDCRKAFQKFWRSNSKLKTA